MGRYWLMGTALGFCVAVAAPAFANGDSNYTPPKVTVGDSNQMARAITAISAKDWHGAISTLNDIAAGDPQNSDAENLLGYSYRMLGQYPEAFLHYDKALALNPTHKGALEYEGEAYLETNQLPKAVANLAALKTACGTAGCTEIAMLDDAIGRYKAKAKIN